MTAELPAGRSAGPSGASLGGGFEPADCSICQLESPERRWPHLVVAESDRWLVRHHASPAPLVGWCLLIARRHVQGPARFDEGEAAEFGLALREVSAAIEGLRGALRVYAIAFGEGSQHTHVHLIPRLAEHPETAAWRVADWYREVESGRRPAADETAIQSFVDCLGGRLSGLPSGRWRRPMAKR